MYEFASKDGGRERGKGNGEERREAARIPLNFNFSISNVVATGGETKIDYWKSVCESDTLFQLPSLSRSLRVTQEDQES
jgi:hypothetical protein